jgi:hypothetical protein
VRLGKWELPPKQGSREYGISGPSFLSETPMGLPPPPPLNKCNSGSKVGTLAGEPQIEISRLKSKTRELDPQSGPHWPVPTLHPRVTATESAQNRVWPTVTFI